MFFPCRIACIHFLTNYLPQLICVTCRDTRTRFHLMDRVSDCAGRICLHTFEQQSPQKYPGVLCTKCWLGEFGDAWWIVPGGVIWEEMSIIKDLYCCSQQLHKICTASYQLSRLLLQLRYAPRWGWHHHQVKEARLVGWQPDSSHSEVVSVRFELGPWFHFVSTTLRSMNSLFGHCFQ